MNNIKLTHPSSVTFSVSDVELYQKHLRKVPYFEAVKQLIFPSERYCKFFSITPIKKIESCSDYRGQLVANIDFHPLMAAIHYAFHQHYPLCLSPDMIWLLIAQGFADHVNANAEKLRTKLVKHQGKATLIVQRNDFIKDSPENPWQDVFSEFSDQIRHHIGDSTHDLLVPTFSTTGKVEKAATEIVLMDAMQSYFMYGLNTLCGIPQIKLEGNVDDWKNLLARTEKLASFGLELWIQPLLPILEQFVLAAQGKVEKSFWHSIYKYNDAKGSGEHPYITGWILAFFPYLEGRRLNPVLHAENSKQTKILYPFFEGVEETKIEVVDRASYLAYEMNQLPRNLRITTKSLPSGLAKAPFKWKYYDQEFNMEFIAGFLGIKQDESFFLRPEIGWVVVELKDSSNSS